MTKIDIDSGWTETEVALIKKTIELFENVTVSPNALDWGWMKMNGRIFGSEADMSSWTFYIHKSRDRFDIQCCATTLEGIESSYLFGVLFYIENGVNGAHVYHNGDG